jgi:predicted DNA-binding helix-hairpin-helix protein
MGAILKLEYAEGVSVDIRQKIDLLGEAAQHDICRGCGSHSSRVQDDLGRWVYPAIRPDGQRISMLKVLQTNVCEKDCAYCANRSGRDIRRTAFTPDELARTFDQMAHRRLVEGLFLSSGICGHADQAMQRMLATVELIRRQYGFRGYIHLKILPGADDASIEAAVRLADRVSVNLEAPNPQRIQHLSHTKDFFRELLAPLRKADEMRQALKPGVSMTTQFVVGAAGESDKEILSSATSLYSNLRLARVYYSAFQPVRDTPLENHDPTPTWREHRLYQADFLLRQYGFTFDEIVFGEEGRLPREADPKLAWALSHPECFPIEINTASQRDLLRIPGIGPRSAQKIIARRKQGRLRELAHIDLPPASVRQAAPFVLLGGKRPSYQLPLFDPTAAC